MRPQPMYVGCLTRRLMIMCPCDKDGDKMWREPTELVASITNAEDQTVAKSTSMFVLTRFKYLF